ncbi:hypothetical protein [Nocardioides insulae]|uniref:hypothetical protein n=1 Tax=Nocardioides insulae TaxID=394734 RepID=UPI00040F415B|nr:hypothetical protein [Nocardioides insulae]
MVKRPSITLGAATTALGLALGLAPAGAAGAPIPNTGDVDVTRTDPAGDVVLTDDRGTPAEVVKRSPSDVTRVRIRAKRTGPERYLTASFKVRKATLGRPGDQTTYVLRLGYLKTVRVTPLRTHVRKLVFNDAGLVGCQGIKTRMRTDIDRFWFKVPRPCLRRALIDHTPVQAVTVRTKDLRGEYTLTYKDTVRPTPVFRP